MGNLTIKLLSPDLASISKAYGKTYGTDIGEVAYTKLVEPKGFVLQSQRDQLRFYMYRKKLGDTLTEKDKQDVVADKFGVWEHAWGLTSILQEGIPTTADLLAYKMKQSFKAGILKLDDPEKFAADVLKGYADTGSHVHKAAENLLLGKEVTVAGRDKKEQWGIISIANFINDHQIRKIQTEQIVVFDKIINGTRVLYAGTMDLICEIYDENTQKWETWLIDFKTSADAHLSHRLQVKGYGAAAEQCLGVKIDRYGILLLGKRTVKGYQLVEVGKERRTITFDDVINVYKMALLMNGGKLPAPTYKVFPTTIQIVEEKADVNISDNSDSSTGIRVSNSNSGGGQKQISANDARRKIANSKPRSKK